MNIINVYNYSNLMRELETRRTNVITQMNNPSSENKKPLQKEIVKLNSILNNMADYKINFMDEQPIVEPKKPNKNTKKETQSYGISSMLK